MLEKYRASRHFMKGMLALSVAGALALTACAGGGSGTPTSKNGTTMVVGLGAEPKDLNAAINTDQNSQMVSAAIYEGLIEVDKAGEIHPSLATEWEMSDDGLTYTFKLRDDVSWTDGEKFTSADVKYSLENALGMNPAGTQIAALISSVETPDDTTVIVTLSSPFAPFLTSMRRMTAAVLPEHLFAGDEVTNSEANREPVGTGPFMFDSWKAGESITLKQNPEYWGDKAEIEQIIYRIIPDNTTRVNALNTGDVDFVMEYWVPYSSVAQLKENDNLYALDGRVMPTFEWLSFNTLQEPLNDPKVRQALYMGIDRNLINQSVFDSNAEPSTGIIPPGIPWAHNADSNLMELYPYDVDAANKLLDEAGFPKDSSGKRFSIDYVFSNESDPAQGPVGDILKAGWEQLGVETNLVGSDLQVWLDSVYGKSEFGASMALLTTRNDPALGISRVFMCNPDRKPYTNASGFCDADLDAKWVEAAQAPQDDRAAIYHEITDELHELVPAVPLIDLTGTDVISKRFGNVDAFFDSAGHPELHWTKLTIEG